jgi:chitinase
MVVASVGGAGANFDANTTASVRAKTVADMATLCSTYGYDGIDIDWEFPETTATAAAWGSMISELRVALDAVRPGLTISAAVASGSYYGDWLPISGLKALSWVGVMTYDYAGSWSATSGHDSPLYPSKGGDGGSVSESMDYFITKRGLPSGNVLLGLPFYGQQFGASTIASTPVAPETAPDYKDIVPIMGTSGWVSAWDDSAKVPYLHRSASPGFLSYDDAKSIAAKCAYGKTRAVGGAIIWHLAGDRLSDGSNPLLDAAQPCR